MSNNLPHLQPVVGRSDKPQYRQDLYQKQWRPRYDTYSAYSSSPARSSSPPTTPFTSRHTQRDAYIRSSPEIGADAFRSVRRNLEYPWDGHQASWKASTSSYARGQSVSTANDYPPTSDFEPSEFSEDADRDMPDSDSNDILSKQDSEEEEDVMDDLFGLGGSRSYHTTFRTSAERGLWKSDPIPFKKPAPSLLQTRKSAPSLSRVPTPRVLTPGPSSEPASSTSTDRFRLPTKDQTAETTVIDDVQDISIPIEPMVEDEVASPHTIPSLTSDRDSSEDVDVELDEPEAPSSPLPPSSPPLSPLSRSLSVLSRSTSPLSFAYDDRSSSPLSELPDDYDATEDEEEVDEGPSGDSLNGPTPVVVVMGSASEREPLPPPAPEILPGHHNDESPSHSPSAAPFKRQQSPRSESEVPSVHGKAKIQTEPTPNVTGVSRKEFHLNSDDDISKSHSGPANPSPISSLPTSADFGSSTAHVDRVKSQSPGAVDEEDAQDSLMTLSLTSAKSLPRLDEDGMDIDGEEADVEAKPLKKSRNALIDNHKVSNGASSASSSSSRAPSLEKGALKDVKKDGGDEGPTKKKRKFEEDVGTSSSKEKTKGKGKRKAEKAEDEAEGEENDRSSVAPTTKQKRRKRNEAQPDGSSSTSTKRTTKSKRRAREHSPYDSEPEDQFDELLDAEAQAFHSTICGLVIETMATSRASSLSPSSICKLVLESQPSFKSERTHREWMRIFERVLRDGEVSRGSGVFGKVESSGKDDADRPLEAQWFYVPEKDQDQERAALIRSMMPRPGKRSTTKKYKQYYWKPLGKITRWDSEDEL